MGVHKTINGAYRYRYAPFLMSTYDVTGSGPLALPLGELSPQVTERVLQLFSAVTDRLPSPSSLRSATSPRGRGKGCPRGRPKDGTASSPSALPLGELSRSASPLALPLGELSPQVTERVIQPSSAVADRSPSPSSLRSATSPRGRGKGWSLRPQTRTVPAGVPAGTETVLCPPERFRRAFLRGFFEKGKGKEGN